VSIQDQYGVKGKVLSAKPQTEGRPVKRESGTENKGTKVVVHRSTSKGK
jgi:hypothetical protein